MEKPTELPTWWRILLLSKPKMISGCFPQAIHHQGKVRRTAKYQWVHREHCYLGAPIHLEESWHMAYPSKGAAINISHFWRSLSHDNSHFMGDWSVPFRWDMATYHIISPQIARGPETNYTEKFEEFYREKNSM